MADTDGRSDINFQEKLFETEGDYNIKVGCADGSGFFYCGTVNDLKERLGSIEEYLQSEYKRLYKQIEDDFKQYLKRDVSPNRYVKTYHARTHEIPTVDDYMKNLTDWFELMRKADISVKRAKKRLLNRKPLSERVIVDFYKSFSEEDTWIIIIDGDEEGEFWTLDEAKKGVTDEDA